MDQLKSNPNPQKWWDCIKQFAGYPKRKAISSMVLDNEIVVGNVLANKINDFFISITNELHLYSQNLQKVSSSLMKVTFIPNLLLTKKVCIINCLIFVSRNRQVQTASQIGYLNIMLIS